MNSFQKLLKALADESVNFVVIGAFAAIAHGATQGTDDLDICYERSPSNYKKIIAAIAKFHPRLRDLPDSLKAPFDEHSLAQGANFTLTTDLGKLDLLAEVSGIGGYKEIVRDAKLMKLASDLSSRVASLDTIIRSKEAAGRPKDRATLPELKALKIMKERDHPEG